MRCIIYTLARYFNILLLLLADSFGPCSPLGKYPTSRGNIRIGIGSSHDQSRSYHTYQEDLFVSELFIHVDLNGLPSDARASAEELLGAVFDPYFPRVAC